MNIITLTHTQLILLCISCCVYGMIAMELINRE